MTTEAESVLMILHLKDGRVENVSSFGLSEGADIPEATQQKMAEALRVSAISSARRSEKVKIVRNLAMIAVTLFLVSLVPLAIAMTLLVRDVTVVAGNLRQTTSVLRMNRDSVVRGLDTLARNAEELSPEREQQLLRDVNVVVRRLKPFVDAVRPLFTGADSK